MKTKKFFISIICVFMLSVLSVVKAAETKAKTKKDINNMCEYEEFSAHKLNYIAHSSSSYSEENEQNVEVNFQFSARKSFKSFDIKEKDASSSNNAVAAETNNVASPSNQRKNNIFIAYTQKSFWQIYDEENSKAIRENNYNPEIFYRFCPSNFKIFWGIKMKAIDLGIEHESN